MSKQPEMVERIAKALYEACRPYWLNKDGVESEPWDVPEEGDERAREMWRAFARAAIEAMREPTHAMVTAGIESGQIIGVTQIYQAMVDAALEEKS